MTTDGTHAVIAVSVAVDELKVVLDADHRSRIARERDHRQSAEDGVDSAALEAELAQVRAREQRARRLDEFRGARSAGTISARARSEANLAYAF